MIRPRPQLQTATFGVLVGAVLVATTTALAVGAVAIAPQDLLGALVGQPLERSQELVLLSIRLPRVVLGLAVGAAVGRSVGVKEG